VRPTVLIVDDHADFRAAARDLLEAGGFSVLGEAADGNEACLQVASLQPTIVLLDIQLPGTDGFAVAEALAAMLSPPVVVLISSREAAAYGDRVARSSARGFIAKRLLSGGELAALVG
jgi:DNA-binding NarL/FixJ family response regulator